MIGRHRSYGDPPATRAERAEQQAWQHEQDRVTARLAPPRALVLPTQTPEEIARDYARFYDSCDYILAPWRTA